MTMTARQLAIANENRQIDDSARRAAAAKPRNALEAMAARLEVEPKSLMNTLKATVFNGCRNNEEFVALVVVANAYGLNPLTKEIYAFPAKGGGVVPMVSVDGWNRIMNDHPQHDGIDFDYHYDGNGNLFAIESIIYRKDRSRPTKTMEFMDECKGSTGPWNKSPNRMLRHRALMQGARIAYGFSGIAVEGDEETVNGEFTPVQSLPPRQSLAEELNDEIPAFDKQTGEIIDDANRDPATGMTLADEETARALDQAQAAGETLADIDGPLDTEATDDRPAWWAKVESIRKGLAGAKNKQHLKDCDDEFTRIRAGLPDEVIAELDGLVAARRTALTRNAAES